LKPWGVTVPDPAAASPGGFSIRYSAEG